MTDASERARLRIAGLLEENAMAQDRTKRMAHVQFEELYRRREERKTLLALLKAAGGDPTEFEMAQEALA